MSKRIIEYGKYNKATCSCECVFAFDKEDIVTKENGTKVVICPQCGEECLVQIKGAN